MKILLIHNSHRSGSSSGDDGVFRQEAALLESKGHRVITFNISNDYFDAAPLYKKILFIFQLPWSFSSSNKIRRLIRQERPDIVHIHNIFPLISPSVYHMLRAEGIPIVQTLHDFRFLCTNAFFMRKGNICKECLNGGIFRSLLYGCFKDSRIQTLPVAIMLRLHRYLNTFKTKIDGYICLTESEKNVFIKAGYVDKKLFVKPNFVEDLSHKDRHLSGDYVVFIGRLSEEKGVRTLINAWRELSDIPLKIVGDGVLAEGLKSYTKKLNIKNIDFIGYKPYRECREILSKARFLVFPSIWNETFGISIIEAFSHGKPVLASNLGAMADLVKDGYTGYLFEPGNARELAERVRLLWDNPEACQRMAMNARKEYEEKYTPERNYEMLIKIYREVIEKKRGSGRS